MSTLPLPKVLTQRRTNSLDQEKENFEKSQAISISKAINSQECPVKEKHVRSILFFFCICCGSGLVCVALLCKWLEVMSRQSVRESLAEEV